MPCIWQNYLIVSLVFFGDTFAYTVRDAPPYEKRPTWLKGCKRNDPNVNACLTEMFLGMFPHLAVGIPEIKVDAFEPLTLDRVSISKGHGPITLAGSLYNMTVIGPSNSTPSNTNFSYKNKHWNFDLDLPLLDIRSLYNLKGHILILPLVGNGNSEMKLFEIHTNVFTNISFPLRNGREVVSVDDMIVRFTVGSMKVKLNNLFNGNKVLGQTVNKFINQHAVEIIGELEESIGSSLAVIFKDLMNNIFSKIPIDLWYLTDEQYEQYRKENELSSNKTSTT